MSFCNFHRGKHEDLFRPIELLGATGFARIGAGNTWLPVGRGVVPARAGHGLRRRNKCWRSMVRDREDALNGNGFSEVHRFTWGLRLKPHEYRNGGHGGISYVAGEKDTSRDVLRCLFVGGQYFTVPRASSAFFCQLVEAMLRI